MSIGYTPFGGLEMKNYYERIRELREEQNKKQREIAALLQVGQRTYADYESGKTRIPVERIIILAAYYDVSLDYITGASDIRATYPKQ